MHDDMTFETSFLGLGPFVTALALYQVDGELVVRREGFEFDTAEAITDAYGFGLTWLPPIQR